ncbi:MAG: Gmad2 immunoglobulin-like domain-containing protein [Candidatus Zambryskibacteria bacterium]|nr:Gmad2 immunoglobulin-like domain-containing protein [Candidatus Zambryskibacteria bacterium]
MKYISFIVLALLVLGICFFGFTQYKKGKVITNFVECQKAGNPVSGGLSPRQCLANGVFYTEVLGDKPVVTKPVDDTELIQVASPEKNSKVSSPLVVKGKARGTWYFEASFPVRLLDANGKELAVAPAQAQGEWMTEDFVPFSVSLTFKKPSTATGTLILEKDNPSGEPMNDRSIKIPVTF